MGSRHEARVMLHRPVLSYYTGISNPHFFLMVIQICAPGTEPDGYLFVAVGRCDSEGLSAICSFPLSRFRQILQGCLTALHS